MDTLNVKLENLTDGTLTVRQGDALELKEPNKIMIGGDIKTVSTFLKIRKTTGTGFQVIDKSKAVVTVDKQKGNISLELDPENFYGAVVRGQIEIADELKPFHINQVKTFSKEELVKLIKFNKLHFASADKHAEMLLAFQKVSSSVNITARDSSDDRGNKERDFVKQVESNAPTEFVLNIPIFKGFQPVTFRVNVCLDVTEGSARFWFESIELHEMQQKQLTEIFDEELKAAAGFVIVNK